MAEPEQVVFVPDLADLNGISRVQELENILGEILDLWDDNTIVMWHSASPEEEEVVTDTFDRAGAILDTNDPEEYTN